MSGEHDGYILPDVVLNGSSPRERGALNELLTARLKSRIIPA